MPNNKKNNRRGESRVKNSVKQSNDKSTSNETTAVARAGTTASQPFRAPRNRPGRGAAAKRTMILTRDTIKRQKPSSAKATFSRSSSRKRKSTTERNSVTTERIPTKRVKTTSAGNVPSLDGHRVRRARITSERNTPSTAEPSVKSARTTGERNSPPAAEPPVRTRTTPEIQEEELSPLFIIRLTPQPAQTDSTLSTPGTDEHTCTPMCSFLDAILGSNHDERGTSNNALQPSASPRTIMDEFLDFQNESTPRSSPNATERTISNTNANTSRNEPITNDFLSQIQSTPQPSHGARTEPVVSKSFSIPATNFAATSSSSLNSTSDTSRSSGTSTSDTHTAESSSSKPHRPPVIEDFE